MTNELATTEPQAQSERTLWEKRLPRPKQEQDSPFDADLPTPKNTNDKCH